MPMSEDQAGGRPAYQGAGSAVIAQHFGRNHDQDPDLMGRTLADLADHYGITNSMMRSALRQARDTLARQGKVLVVPTRAEGYVITVTDEEVTFLRGVISRLGPITTEITRYTADHRTVTASATSSIFDPLAMALDDAVAAVADLLLA